MNIDGDGSVSGQRRRLTRRHQQPGNRSISCTGTDETEIDVPFNNSGSVNLVEGDVSLGASPYIAGTSTSSGTFTAAAGTSLSLGGEDLTTTSSVSSGGAVETDSCAVEGSFGAAGGTIAYDSTFTGPVLDVGPSLEVDGTSSFAPAVGGPVTLDTGTLLVTGNLAGTDSFNATGPFTMDYTAELNTTGTVDALGSATLTGSQPLLRHRLEPRRGHHLADRRPRPVPERRAQVNFLPTATVNIDGDGSYLANGDGSPVAINNQGTVTISCTGTDVTEIDVPFNNSGSVVVQQGDVSLIDATNAGSVTVWPGTTLGLGDYTQTAGSTDLDGATVSGGAISIDGGCLLGTGVVNASVTNAGQIIPGGTARPAC